MKLQRVKIGNYEVPPFTIPSGIVMTEVSCAKRLLEMSDKIFWTTKSIGPVERKPPEGDEVENPDPDKEYGNREPIVVCHAPGCWGNAINFINPGAEKKKKMIIDSGIPRERIGGSIFGKDRDEFVYVAKTLEDVVGWLELNFSCPHSEQRGLSIGQDLELVSQITKDLVENIGLPVIPKLSPMINIKQSTRVVMEAGASGVAGINTAGPGYYGLDGHPVLYNPRGHVGGLSGRGIFPLALRAVRDMREVAGPKALVLGIGGITFADDFREMFRGGASVCAPGSVLVGMTDEEIVEYFDRVNYDLEHEESISNELLLNIRTKLLFERMQYQKIKIERRIDAGGDFKIFETCDAIEADPGQFIFAFLPGVGEKPFSVMDDNPFTLAVLTRGYFTERFNQLQEGDEFYFRGPYGKQVPLATEKNNVVVAGGSGIAGVYLIMKRLKHMLSYAQVSAFLGAKDREHLDYFHKLEKYGDVHFATENGSLGKRGTIADLLSEVKLEDGSMFFNCGPKEMIDAVLPLEMKISGPERIYSSLDYITSCGVGICGRCADEKGRRTCVYGPFMQAG